MIEIRFQGRARAHNACNGYVLCANECPVEAIEMVRVEA